MTSTILPLSARTLPALLKERVQLGKKAFIKTAESSLSYEDTLTRTSIIAGKLHASGLRKGDRMVVLLPNCMEVLELFLAAGYLGAVFVPINTAFRGEQLKNLLELADPTAIVTSPEYQEHVVAAKAKMPSLSRVWALQDGSEDAKRLAGPAGTTVEPWHPGNTPLPEQDIQPSDPLAILYTSGTTGPSKGVLCPHGQFYWWGVLTGDSLSMTEEDVTYTVLPMFHTNALNALWQVLVHGATYAFGKRFSASKFLNELREHDATLTYMLGSIAYILLKQPESDKDKQHKVRRALSPATSEKITAEFESRFNFTLVEGYGSTETNLVFSNHIGEYEPACMGRPFPQFDVRIVDENDCDVKPGETGELIIRNHEPFSMALGYFRNDAATVAAWRNLWFHTGDRVKQDESGVYRFVDRMKDAIRRRGENISSWEVEQAMISHPQVEDVAVVGVPSELGEEEVMAFVVPKGKQAVDPLDLITYMEAQIAGFAIPEYFEFLDTMPRTENGKVKKYELKERGTGKNTWRRTEKVA